MSIYIREDDFFWVLPVFLFSLTLRQRKKENCVIRVKLSFEQYR